MGAWHFLRPQLDSLAAFGKGHQSGASRPAEVGRGLRLRGGGQAGDKGSSS